MSDIFDVAAGAIRQLTTDDLAGAGGGGGGGHDRELVVTTYRCKTAFTGASVGDTITCTQVLDVKTTIGTVSTVWRNQTAAADLASAPSAANLELTGATAITDAQLRASAVSVEPLGVPGVARQLTAAATSVNHALTITCRRVSIRARNADVRFAIGTGAQTAVSTTSHYLAQDERLDFSVPANANIAVIRDSLASSDGIVCLTELV